MTLLEGLDVTTYVESSAYIGIRLWDDKISWDGRSCTIQYHGNIRLEDTKKQLQIDS